jgi:hypothetical protein
VARHVIVGAVVDHMGQQEGAIRLFEEGAASSPSSPTASTSATGDGYRDITSIGHSAHTCHR